MNSGLGWLSLNQNQINYNGQSKEREMLKSQWELKTKTTKLPKARENAGDQVVISVSLHLIGWESGASFLDQAQSKVKQNRINFGTPSKIVSTWCLL